MRHREFADRCRRRSLLARRWLSLVTDVELCGFSDVVGRPCEVSTTKRGHQVNSNLKVELHCPVVVDVVMVHLEWCHRPGELSVRTGGST